MEPLGLDVVSVSVFVTVVLHSFVRVASWSDEFITLVTVVVVVVASVETELVDATLESAGADVLISLLEARLSREVNTMQDSVDTVVVVVVT